MPVTFVSTNEAVATVASKAGSDNVGVITANAIGEAEVYAVCGDMRSSSVKVTVAEISDVTITSGTGQGRNDTLTLNLKVGTESVKVTLPVISSKYGHYTGNDATVEVSSIVTSNCSYDFTVTQVDTRNATFNGYVQLPNGQKYIMDNLTIMCQFR